MELNILGITAELRKKVSGRVPGTTYNYCDSSLYGHVPHSIEQHSTLKWSLVHYLLNETKTSVFHWKCVLCEVRSNIEYQAQLPLGFKSKCRVRCISSAQIGDKEIRDIKSCYYIRIHMNFAIIPILSKNDELEGEKCVELNLFFD